MPHTHSILGEVGGMQKGDKKDGKRGGGGGVGGAGRPEIRGGKKRGPKI